MTARYSLLFLSMTALSAAGIGHAAQPTAVAVPNAATPDHCAGAPRCYDAGTFVAEVMQISASAMTAGARNQSVTINIRFRNVSDKPVILAYRAGSSSALDNFGNGFTWGRPGTHDVSVKGIGMVEGRNVDTQFTLGPGQTRSAAFGLIRFNAKPPIGAAWNYDLVIEEIEVLPGQVVRSARQNSISYANLRAGTFPAAASAGGPGADVAPTADPVDVAGRMIDLFKRAQKRSP